jgi:hypothetical protein
VTGAAALAGWSLSMPPESSAVESAGALYVAPFRFDVTPPLGHGCCGGWIKPIAAVDDAEEAVGIVLLGAGRPIVLCAVDWTGILNEAHIEWRTALAEAALTTPDRVAVQCVHQHDAPMACLEAERFVAAQGDLPHIMMVDFFRRTLDTARQAVATAIPRAKRVTHVAWGQAPVHQVASNRRVYRDDSGRVLAMRGSACRNEKLIALSDGLIDPNLKTVAFYDGAKKIAALHYYSTHPMSYHGNGRASSDFVGLARKQRQQDESECLHVYFTGCAGNVAAGKYNRGDQEARQTLTRRMYEGIVASEARLERAELKRLAWNTVDLVPVPNASLQTAALEKQIAKAGAAVAARNRPAYELAWLRRLEKRLPIVLSSLHIGGVRLLHLPGEPFVEYQLRAQNLAAESFVATAGYGDGGPWYIPTQDEYPHGGYEVSVAFCDAQIDAALTAGIRRLVGAPT